MDWPSGTAIYTRDLALELQRQGHRPIVCTWLKGRASQELAAAGIGSGLVAIAALYATGIEGREAPAVGAWSSGRGPIRG
jgi:hypothetical protein